MTKYVAGVLHCSSMLQGREGCQARIESHDYDLEPHGYRFPLPATEELLHVPLAVANAGQCVVLELLRLVDRLEESRGGPHLACRYSQLLQVLEWQKPCSWVLV